MSRCAPLLLDAADSRLIIVDVQPKLASAMPPADREQVLRNATRLVQSAARLDVPSIATEQYRKGLGATEEDLCAHFPPAMPVLEKTCFACTGAEGFLETLRGDRRRQIVLVGMEAHVCVLQTAMQLLDAGFWVYVVEDAVCSRHNENRRNAVERMRQAGVTLTNTESVIFEWLRDARHEHFKALSALVK